MSGQTPRGRRWRERREVDPEVVRYFVYFLCDADGIPVYIGRSCNVPQRIRAHHAKASSLTEGWDTYRARDWFFDVRSVDMVGPFNWRDVVKRERAEIERHQPRGNRDLTARDHRPAVAMRSAARAEAKS